MGVVYFLVGAVIVAMIISALWGLGKLSNYLGLGRDSDNTTLSGSIKDGGKAIIVGILTGVVIILLMKIGQEFCNNVTN